jgi:hypothetical protein
VSPLVLFYLLSGCRAGEGFGLKWPDFRPDAPDENGKAVGEIHLDASAVKTACERVIDLSVCPSIRTLLTVLKLKAGDTTFVFGGKVPLPRQLAEAARRRLIRTYGAPQFCWQRLRQTCESYLTNAPGIYGAGAIYRAAVQLGNSPAVAHRHYLGVIRGIPREARTLEVAMQVEDLAQQIIDRTRGTAADVGSLLAASQPPHAAGGPARSEQRTVGQEATAAR